MFLNQSYVNILAWPSQNTILNMGSSMQEPTGTSTPVQLAWPPCRPSTEEIVLNKFGMVTTATEAKLISLGLILFFFHFSKFYFNNK